MLKEFLQFNNQKIKTLIEKGQKFWTAVLPKKVSRWKISYAKIFNTIDHCVSANKSNEILVSLEWLKLERLIISSSSKDVEQLELSYITGGNAKKYSHDGKQFGSFLES